MRNFIVILFLLTFSYSAVMADGRVSLIIPENIPFSFSKTSTGETILSLQKDIEGYIGNNTQTFLKPEISIYDSHVFLSNTAGSYQASLNCFERFLASAMDNREKPIKGQKFYFVMTFSRANIVPASDPGRIGILRIDRNDAGEQESSSDCAITNSLGEARRIAASKFVAN